MDFHPLLRQIDEDERISFEDKLSLAFIVMGAIFLAIIVLSLLLNAMQFEQMEFEGPFM